MAKITLKSKYLAIVLGYKENSYSRGCSCCPPDRHYSSEFDYVSVETVDGLIGNILNFEDDGAMGLEHDEEGYTVHIVHKNEVLEPNQWDLGEEIYELLEIARAGKLEEIREREEKKAKEVLKRKATLARKKAKKKKEDELKKLAELKEKYEEK